MTQNKDKGNRYDLEERTAKFAEEVILFCKTLPDTIVNRQLIPQLIKAATSIAANYCEADDAESKNDFKHKIGICKKESRETKHWLRMVAVANSEHSNKSRTLWQEAKELNLIFNAITIKLVQKI
jgi:four helix bundle protein